MTATRCREIPNDSDAHFARLDDENVARVHARNYLTVAELLSKQCCEQARRPKLTEARNHIAAAIRSRLHERERLEHTLDIGNVLVEFLDQLTGALKLHQGFDDPRIALTQRRDRFGRILLTRCTGDEIEQRIGHAADCRDDDTRVARRLIQDDSRDASKTRRIGQAAATKFMDGPTHGIPLKPSGAGGRTASVAPAKPSAPERPRPPGEILLLARLTSSTVLRGWRE